MKKDFEVFGGVAEQSVEDFQRVVNLLYKNCDGIHVDIADEVFVANKFADLESIILPEDMFCEAHLMIENPESAIKICKQKKFQKLIIHPSSLMKLDIGLYKEMYRSVRDQGMILFWGYEIGAFPEEEHLQYADGVLFMTVPLGFAGGMFEHSQLEVIARFKKRYPEFLVEVDGGVSDKTIDEIKKIGVGQVTSTSWLQSGESVQQNYLYLKNREYKLI